MKLFLYFLIFLSIVIIGWVSYNLFNVYTSLKYEVEEPIAMSKAVNEIVTNKELYLKNLIFWLWLIIITQIINVIIFSIVLAKSSPSR